MNDDRIKIEEIKIHAPDFETAIKIPVELEKATGYDCSDFAIRPDPEGGWVITYEPN